MAELEALGLAAMQQAGFERVEAKSTDGRRLVVWRAGSGPDLLLLHGAGQRAASWAAVAPGLTAAHTVHAFDLPGHGESEPVDGPLLFATIVGGVESYLTGLEPKEGRGAILVGNSLGAWLGTLMAHRHPDRVERVVLVNGGALLNIPAEGLTLQPADREAARRVMAALRDPSSPELSDAVLDEIVVRSATGPIARMMPDLAGMMAHLLEGRLNEIEVPVDLLWGVADQLMPLSYARRMHEQLPRARLTELEHCGHAPPRECPRRFLEALQQILAQERPPAAPRRTTDGAGATSGAATP